MKRTIFSTVFLTALIGICALQWSKADVAKTPNTSGSFAIVETQGRSILIEQQAGRTWILVDANSNHRAWVAIPRFDDEKSYREWLNDLEKKPKTRNPELIELEENMAKLLEAERRLLATFGDKHPEVIKIRKQIEIIKSMSKKPQSDNY